MSTATQATKQAIPAGTFVSDPVHSSIGFAVVHNGVSVFRSGFGDFDVRLAGGENPQLKGSVEVESIRIEEEQLRGHLLSPEFFDTQRHPRLRFASDELSVAEDGSLHLRGELEIRGEAREVAAGGRFAQLGEDAQGTGRVGLSVRTAVDRRDFGLDWNAELPSGGQVLDFEVEIAIELELVEEGE